MANGNHPYSRIAPIEYQDGFVKCCGVAGHLCDEDLLQGDRIRGTARDAAHFIYIGQAGRNQCRRSHGIELGFRVILPWSRKVALQTYVGPFTSKKCVINQ